MKTWVVRFGSLWVFNIVVLLLIGAILPRVSVGFFAALWGGLVLTAATIWIKPLITGWLKSAAEKRNDDFRNGKNKLIEYGLVFVVAFVVWVIVLIFSGVNARGFWGLVIPPLLLLAAWFIYDIIDDRVEKVAGDLYDKATGALDNREDTPAPQPESQATRDGREELKDGLTPEQRKLMDEL